MALRVLNDEDSARRTSPRSERVLNRHSWRLFPLSFLFFILTFADSTWSWRSTLTASAQSSPLITHVPLSGDTLGDFNLPVAFNEPRRRIYVAEVSPSVIDADTYIGLSNSMLSGRHISFNASQNRIYSFLSSGNSGELRIYDGNDISIIKRIDVGRFNFSEMEINERTNRIYLTSGTLVAVYDGNTDALVTTISLPNSRLGFVDQDHIAVNRQTNRIYVASTDSVYVIDGNSNTVIATVPVPQARGIAVNSDTNRVYVGSGSSHGITVIDGASNSVVSTAFPSIASFRASHIVLNEQTRVVYVLYKSGSADVSPAIVAFDGSANSQVGMVTNREVWQLTNARDMEINAAYNRLYVTVLGSGQGLLVFDAGAIAGGGSGIPQDTVSIVSVSPSPGTAIPSGQQHTFQVRLRYSLSSAASANLLVAWEQFAGQTSCTGTNHSTNGGTQQSVTRGSGELTLTVPWFGAPGSGRIGLFARLSTVPDPFVFWDDYCYSYGVGSSPEERLATIYRPVLMLAARDYRPKSAAIFLKGEGREVAAAALKKAGTTEEIANPTFANICGSAQAPNPADYYLDIKQLRPSPLDVVKPYTLDDEPYLNRYNDLDRQRNARGEPLFPDTVYWRVVPPSSSQTQTVLQFWFFYFYNDWTNNHEGDWEMVSLIFSGTPAQIIANPSAAPTRVVYSAHANTGRNEMGGTWATWDYVHKEGLRPIVYVGQGSHANYFRPGTYRYGGNLPPFALIRGDDETSTEFALREYDYQQRRFPADLGTNAGGCASDEEALLRFAGKWGEPAAGGLDRLQCPFGCEGPGGPARKENPWSNPVQWAGSLPEARSYWQPCAPGQPAGATEYCAGGGFSGPLAGAAPIITIAAPLTVTAGSPGFTLTVSGLNLPGDAAITWNGARRPTTFVSNTRLTAEISAADIAEPGVAEIAVVDSLGRTSNVVRVVVLRRLFPLR